MTSVRDLINQTVNEILMGTYRAHYNALANTINASVPDITLSYPIVGIGDGSYMEIENELVYVIPGGVNANSKTLTNIRGARGTTAATHSSGVGVEINPRYPRVNILNTMLEEIRSWPDTVFRPQVFPVNVAAGSSVIDIDAAIGTLGITDTIKVLNVWRQKEGTDIGRWIRVTGWRYEPDIESIGGESTGSGAVYLDNDVHCARAGATTYRVLVGRKFGITPWSEATDVTADLGIPSTMNDILKYGAAWRLVTGRETRRLFTEAEGESKKGEEVPVQASAKFGRDLKAVRDLRLSEEKDRLIGRYGIRTSNG